MSVACWNSSADRTANALDPFRMRLARVTRWDGEAANQSGDLAKIPAVPVLDEGGELLNTFVITVHKRSVVDLSFSLWSHSFMCHENHPVELISHRNICSTKGKMY